MCGTTNPLRFCLSSFDGVGVGAIVDIGATNPLRFCLSSFDGVGVGEIADSTDGTPKETPCGNRVYAKISAAVLCLAGVVFRDGFAVASLSILSTVWLGFGGSANGRPRDFAGLVAGALCICGADTPTSRGHTPPAHEGIL